MKPIFSRNPDIDKMAFLNWRFSEEGNIHNLLNLADGFLLSALELSTQCLINNDGKRADILIFPILTNANHGIELYLKAINWMLNKLTNSNMKIEGKHNIKQLFETVRSKAKKYRGLQKVNFDEENKELKDYIVELFSKINATSQNDRMDFSRYPFSTNYENHFYVTQMGNEVIDLEIFNSSFKIIRQKLELLSDYLYYHELAQTE